MTTVYPFPSKTALIFGGTSGIGLATASTLAQNGVRSIAISGRNAERGIEALKQLSGLHQGCNFHFIPGDVSNPDEVEHVVEDALQKLGQIDLSLISIAPSVLPAIFSTHTSEEIEKSLNVTLLGPIYACKCLTEAMRERRSGSIVVIASDAAKTPTPGETVIGASMGGLSVFARTLAIEEKRHGIRVNCVTPSIVQETELYDELMLDDFCKGLFGKAEARASLGVPTADEVAELVCFLLSDAARKISGQAISINGGISAQ